MEGGVSDDGVMEEFGGRFEVVNREGGFRGRLQGKVSEEDLWVGFDLILVRLCNPNLAIYVCQGLILARIHVEVSVCSFRGQF